MRVSFSFSYKSIFIFEVFDGVSDGINGQFGSFHQLSNGHTGVVSAVVFDRVEQKCGVDFQFVWVQLSEDFFVYHDESISGRLKSVGREPSGFLVHFLSPGVRK